MLLFMSSLGNQLALEERVDFLRIRLLLKLLECLCRDICSGISFV